MGSVEAYASYHPEKVSTNQRPDPSASSGLVGVLAGFSGAGKAANGYALPDYPALALLKSVSKWVAWKYATRNGRPTKLPICPHTGSIAKTDTPGTWADYNDAVARAHRDKLAGVGYVLTDDDGLTGADLDHVRNAETGALEPWAAEIVALAETYIEISPSGTGLRIFWSGKIDRSFKNTVLSVEVYRNGRYLTVTGNHVSGTPTEILPAPKTEAALRARVNGTKIGEEVPAISQKGDSGKSRSQWQKINDKALQNLPAWVPALFGEAAVLKSGGYRISSKALGRDLQEDLSISPKGIVDFGIADQGDRRQGRRSPIDVIKEYGKTTTITEAVEWLCERLRMDPPSSAKGGVSLTDFYAYLPRHSYIYTPVCEMWPASSINSCLGSVPICDADGKTVLDENDEEKLIAANAWLDQNRSVEQMTWAPGLPMVIRNRLISEGGWIERPNVSCFNLYRPPTIELGNAAEADRWLDHLHKVFSEDDVSHIVRFLAHRVQRPQEKINHALLLAGDQGIGKDSLLEPVKYAVGPWNFAEVSPQHMLGRFNGFVKSVILRVSEVRDLGSEFNRFSFYDHMKTYTAAPPDVLRVDEKNLREHSVLNCCGVIETSNYKTDGIYLPADDRRHYVAWSDRKKEDFVSDYWKMLWGYYEKGGFRHVAAYLAELDISAFDPKAPPPKTAAFWAIVDANRAPEDSELADVLDKLGRPDATTLLKITEEATDDFYDWIRDRRNRRAIPHRLEKCGYVPVRNDAAQDGLWVIKGKRQAVYARADLPMGDKLKSAGVLAKAK